MKRCAYILLVTRLIFFQLGPGYGTAAELVSMEKNARAFLFVLEFVLGAPLIQTQENVILKKLLEGWKTKVLVSNHPPVDRDGGTRLGY